MASKTKITYDVMRKLPKAELHKHLDGSVRVSTIIELAKEQGVELPTFDEDELRKLVSVGDSCPSLVEYLRGFDITLKVLQRSYALTRVMYEVCEDSWNDGVRYLEIRFSPILHINEGLSLGGVMEAVCEGLALARYHFPITVNIIVCAMRQLPSNVTQDIAEIAWRYRHKGVSGFDLAGPEYGFSSKLHRAAFDVVRARSINCTLHSGEAAGWESVRDSIRYCGANRIGHGVRLIENPALLEYVVSHRIVIESCPTSNVHTKAVERIEDHPIRKFFDAGAIVVPCTDNTTVSNCTLTGEYMLLIEKFGFSLEEVVRLLDYGFQGAFINATEKRRLRADALHQTLKTLKEEGYDISSILKEDMYYRSIGCNLAEFIPESGHTVDRKRERKPVVTAEILRGLPKTDLHCRLDGSISITQLWKEIQDDKDFDLKAVTGLDITSMDQLQEFMSTAEAKKVTDMAKDVTRLLLQNPGQLERAVDDIVRHAADDGVKYMEMVVRPNSHTNKGLSPVTVMDIVCSKIQQLSSVYPVKVGVVIYVSIVADDPISFREMAKLAVDYQQKNSIVVGFGIYGDVAIPAESFRFFKSTFDFLKSHNVNLAMVAGITGVDTIVTAIHEGGASRLSGCFQVHKYPRLMNYIASFGIPVELSLTPKLLEYTKSASFGGNAIRLLLDNEVPVTICSFRSLFVKQNRIEMLEEIVKECHLTMQEVVKLFSNGFRFNFQNSTNTRLLQEQYWKETKEFLAKNGIEDLFDVPFFPEK